VTPPGEVGGLAVARNQLREHQVVTSHVIRGEIPQLCAGFGLEQHAHAAEFAELFDVLWHFLDEALPVRAELVHHRGYYHAGGREFEALVFDVVLGQHVEAAAFEALQTGSAQIVLDRAARRTRRAAIEVDGRHLAARPCGTNALWFLGERRELLRRLAPTVSFEAKRRVVALRRCGEFRRLVWREVRHRHERRLRDIRRIRVRQSFAGNQYQAEGY